MRNALVQGGITADHVKTISYGKEKPFCTESNERAGSRTAADTSSTRSKICAGISTFACEVCTFSRYLLRRGRHICLQRLFLNSWVLFAVLARTLHLLPVF